MKFTVFLFPPFPLGQQRFNLQNYLFLSFTTEMVWKEITKLYVTGCKNGMGENVYPIQLDDCSTSYRATHITPTTQIYT